MFAALHHIGLIKRKLRKPRKVWIEKACRVAYRHADSLEETIFSQGEAEDGEEQEQVEDEVEEEEEKRRCVPRDKSVSDRTRGHLLVVEEIKMVAPVWGGNALSIDLCGVVY